MAAAGGAAAVSPMALAEGLRDTAAQAGVASPPLVAGRARQVSVKLPLDELAERMADMLGRKDGSEGLFLYGDEVVTVQALTGEIRVMKPVVFRTWIVADRGVVPVVKWVQETGEVIKGGFSKDQADVVLNSFIFRDRLPVLRKVHKVRLPVVEEGEDGAACVRLLPLGYDAATGIYTAGTLDYLREGEMEPVEAATYFYKLFQYFGWKQVDRDFAIHLAALVTMYGRGLYDGKAPMVVYNANMQESGKTTLATYVTWLVHGTRQTMTLMKDEETKLKEELNSVALNGLPYVIFDNVTWGNAPVRTELLDTWISNAEWPLRKLHTQSMAAPVLEGVTLMTGNELKLSPDLSRRSLMVDLWNPETGAERALHEKPADMVMMDGLFFQQERYRVEGLRALWALVKGWYAAGRPAGVGRILGSFESWSRYAPWVVAWAGNLQGLALDCMADGENPDIGDTTTRQYQQLARLAIAEFGPHPEEGFMRESFEILVKEFAGVARRNEVATHNLYPEMTVEDVLATEQRRDGFKFEPVPGAKSAAVADVDDWMSGAAEETQEGMVLKVRQASEWLNAKTRSAFGKGLDSNIKGRWFKGPDGLTYHVLKAPNPPARYLVKRVVEKRR